MDLFFNNLELLYQKYDDLKQRNALLSQKIEENKKKKEQEDIKFLDITQKIGYLCYIENVLRGKYKKEDRKIKRQIFKTLMIPSLLVLSLLVSLLFGMPVITFAFILFLVPYIVRVDYIFNQIKLNALPLIDRKKIKANYKLDDVLLKMLNLANKGNVKKNEIKKIDAEQQILFCKQKEITESLGLVDQAIAKIKCAYESTISDILSKNDSLESKLNQSFLSNQDVLKLIKKINLSKEDK